MTDYLDWKCACGVKNYHYRGQEFGTCKRCGVRIQLPTDIAKRSYF